MLKYETKRIYNHNNIISYHSNIIKYYRHGLQHRKGSPCTMAHLGSMWWGEYGKAHRVDGPATIYSTGKQEYYKRGKPC